MTSSLIRSRITVISWRFLATRRAVDRQHDFTNNVSHCSSFPKQIYKRTGRRPSGVVASKKPAHQRQRRVEMGFQKPVAGPFKQMQFLIGQVAEIGAHGRGWRQVALNTPTGALDPNDRTCRISATT